MAQPVPTGFRSVTPHLTVRGAAQAIDFYRKAFGAEELNRMASPDGSSIWNATIRIGDSVLMLNDEFPEQKSLSPLAHGGTAVTIHLYVDDADAVHRRAVEAGATSTMAVEDTFWGDRYGTVRDPFGHAWAIATHKEDPTPEQMYQRVEAMMKGAGKSCPE